MSNTFAISGNESFTALNPDLTNQGPVQQTTMVLTTVALQTERLQVSAIFSNGSSITPTVNFQCVTDNGGGLAQSGVSTKHPAPDPGTQSSNTGAPWPLIADMLNQMDDLQAGQSVSLRFYLTLAGKKMDIPALYQPLATIPPPESGPFNFGWGPPGAGQAGGDPVYFDPSTNGPVFNTLNVQNLSTGPNFSQQQSGHTTQVTFSIVVAGKAPSWDGSWMTVDAVEISLLS